MTQLQVIKDALRRKAAYRRVFLADNEDARLVLRDLLRQVMPRTSMLVPGKPDETQANAGAHGLAAGMLRLIFKNDEDLKRQLSELLSQEGS